jgi:hypothetical protein
MINQKIGSGPEDFSLDYANLFLDNAPVASGETLEVDPETSHVLKLAHSVLNADPRSLGDPIGVWRTCTTIFNVTDNAPVKAITAQADGGSGGGNAQQNVGVITRPITFRIKLWANQNDGAVPPASNYW